MLILDASNQMGGNLEHLKESQLTKGQKRLKRILELENAIVDTGKKLKRAEKDGKTGLATVLRAYRKELWNEWYKKKVKIGEGFFWKQAIPKFKRRYYNV
jgi:hypothetical protein